MLLFECFSGNMEGLSWTTGGDQRWTCNLTEAEGRKTWVYGLWSETTWVLIMVGHWARPTGFQSCLTPWTSYLAWGEVPLLTKGDDGDNDDDTTYISKSCVNKMQSLIKVTMWAWELGEMHLYMKVEGCSHNEKRMNTVAANIQCPLTEPVK